MLRQRSTNKNLIFCFAGLTSGYPKKHNSYTHITCPYPPPPTGSHVVSTGSRVLLYRRAFLLREKKHGLPVGPRRLVRHAQAVFSSFSAHGYWCCIDFSFLFPLGRIRRPEKSKNRRRVYVEWRRRKKNRFYATGSQRRGLKRFGEKYYHFVSFLMTEEAHRCRSKSGGYSTKCLSVFIQVSQKFWVWVVIFFFH